MVGKYRFISLDDIKPKLKEYVEEIDKQVVDIQWKKINRKYRSHDKLLIDPSQNTAQTAHYFLLVASISETRLISHPSHGRSLIRLLHNELGEELYTIQNDAKIEGIIKKYPFFPYLGEQKEEIPSILVEINKFVQKIADASVNESLIEYSKQFSNPYEFVNDIQNEITTMNRNVEKAWIYLKWMTRNLRGCRVYNHFSPSDLYMPLTSYIREVADRLDAKGEYRNWPPSRDKIEEIRIELTNFVKELFPDDPLKVDYPFVLLGNLVKGKPHTRKVLLDELEKLIENPYNLFPSSNVQSKHENDVIDELKENNIHFFYEPSEYGLPPECWSKKYLPDFILPDTIVNGKKVVIECHGMWSILRGHLNTKRNEDWFINKMKFFSEKWGNEFFIILFVPRDSLNYVKMRYSDYFNLIYSYNEISILKKIL
ncbi:MAG: DUF2400 family protein [Candidatus Odinarchaeia archaeon]